MAAKAMERKKRGILKTAPFLLVLIVGFAVYGTSLNNEFLWDDELLITDNDVIKDLRNIPILFTKNIAYGTSDDSNYYRPLQTLSYALNYAIWKLDVRAYHITNITLHIFVALLLYWLAQLLFHNQAVSLLSAILFISHPIHTSAVTYVAGRADPLAALFILSSVIFYIRYAQKEKRTSYFSSLFAYLCALLSKETGLIVPLLLLAYDSLYKSKNRVTLKSHLPFLSLGLIYIVLRKSVLNFPVTIGFVGKTSFLQRIPVMFKSLAMYFGKLLVPLNLHMEYERIIPSMADIQVILGMALAAMLFLVAIIYRKTEKLISFSLAWFLINYLPVSNIYPLNVFFAEHWIYLPSLGLFILVGWVIVRIYEKGRLFRYFVSLMLVFLLSLSFYLTSKQNQYWESAEYFYKRTLQFAPQSAKIYFRLSRLYYRKGMLDKNIENLNKVVEISPDYLVAYEDLAASYVERGQPDQAIAICHKALNRGLDSDILRNNLRVAYEAQR